MTPQEIDRIECAIRHIESSLDVDPWAVDIAVEAMKTQLPGEGTTSDLISRQAAIDRINKQREHLQPGIYPQDKIGDAAYRICAEFIERLPSAQPTLQPTCNELATDTISRQDAIDALCSECQGQCIPCESYPCSEVEAINALPSAHPEIEERKEEFAQNVPKEDLISRNAAIEALKNERSDWNCDYNVPVDHCIDAIYSVPSAQPEIIRCKDCRWRKDQSGSAAWLPCRAIVTPSDFYCCRAER